MSKERPILFSGPMVRAIIEGRKTQTRRLCKPANKESLSFVVGVDGETWGDEEGDVNFRCPHGREGDRLWVRETWIPDPPITDDWASTQYHGCAGSHWRDIPERHRTPDYCLFRSTWDGQPLTGWKPSIHMPRWASRITIEITGVRVERLRDLSVGDVMSEGCPFPRREETYTPIEWYAGLWDQINGAGSWASNPWVWALNFKVLERSK